MSEIYYAELNKNKIMGVSRYDEYLYEAKHDLDKVEIYFGGELKKNTLYKNSINSASDFILSSLSDFLISAKDECCQFELYSENRFTYGSWNLHKSRLYFNEYRRKYYYLNIHDMTQFAKNNKKNKSLLSQMNIIYKDEFEYYRNKLTNETLSKILKNNYQYDQHQMKKMLTEAYETDIISYIKEMKGF